MFLKNLKWLWEVSAPICEQRGDNMLKGKLRRVRILKRRIGFIAKATRLIGSLGVFMHPQPGSPLGRAMEQRPEMVGVVLWPYICTSWSAKTCLHRIEEHFKVIETMGSKLDFPINKALQLLDLGDVAPNLAVVLDQPKWFMREGLLVISLFASDVRFYSLAFSYAFESGRIVAYIGAIQGVDAEGILESYRDLTKILHGMRPRDFLVELFRIFCRRIGVSKIYAVDDAKRQHRSEYFGAVKSESLFVNYNAIWMERGGVLDSEDFFVLSLETPMKSLDAVPAKKRAMYRRRYELLQTIEERMQSTLEDQATNNVIPVLGRIGYMDNQG